MKLWQIEESNCDLNINKQICDESIRKLFANYSKIEKYLQNTDWMLCSGTRGQFNSIVVLQ